MKINKIVFFLMIFISSCQLVDGRMYAPVYLANGYFDDTVKTYIYQNYVSYDDNKTIGQKWNQVAFNLGTPNPIRLELSPNGRWMAPVLELKVKKDNCIIQKYTNDELIRLKLNAGYKAEDNNVVFIVTKDNISVTSLNEYEKLRLTFKSHSYDASLCKLGGIK